MYKCGNEEMVLCPYDSSHIVSKLRIQKHIVKCQSNNPNIRLSTCFYNYAHRLKPEELLKHYEICSHRTRVQGTRYFDEENISKFSEKSEDLSFNFPRSRVTKSEDFNNPCSVVSDSSEESFKSKTNIDLPNYESNRILSSSLNGKPNFQKNYENEDDDVIDEPLPLPKTKSKAFTFINEQKEKETVNLNVINPGKGFGRAKNILAYSSPKKTRTTDHLLPDISDMKISSPGKDKISKFFSSSNISGNESVSSFMFDDSKTLKSQKIIFDDDCDDTEDEEDDDNDYIFENLDKYIKVLKVKNNK